MKLNKTEIIILIYLILTSILLLFSKEEHIVSNFITNMVLIFLIISVAYTDNKSNKYHFYRIIYPVFLLGHLYGETYLINHIIFKHNLDYIFINIDQKIFGFQPSLLFSKVFTDKWLSELLFFSYLSFLFMPITTILIFYFFKRELLEKIVFLLITSFITYYLIFILLPVVGPQFYFQGDIAHTPAYGFFGKAVKFIQKHTEHPTGAFPSSHVGMSIIISIILYKNFKKLFYFILPPTVLILFATIYIKAHYATDVLAGIISAPLVLIFSLFLWSRIDIIQMKIPQFGLKLQKKLKKILLMLVAK